MKSDFTSRTKLYLAKRAGEKCSICKITTSKPKGKDGFINMGEAAHIKGNRSGQNNRYDSSLSKEERMNISNAIWLCPTCHKKIDSDEQLYTVKYLEKIKLIHELEVFNGLFDKNYLPVLKEYEEKIFLLKKLIKEKEKNLKKSELLFSQELNVLKEKLYNAENEKKEKITISNEILFNLLKIDVEKNHLLFDKVLDEYKKGNLNIALDLLDEELLLKKEKNNARLRLIKANMFSIQNNIEKALENYRKSFEINSDYEFFHPYLNFLHKNLMFKEQIQICKKVLSVENDISTKAYVFCCLGVIYRDLEKFELSIKYSLKGLKALESLKEQDSKEFKLDKARQLNTLGISYKTIGDLKQSLKAYEESLNLYFQISIKNDTIYSDDLVGLYNNIGNTYKEGNDVKGALDSFLYAYNILKKINSKSLDRAILCLNLRNCYLDRFNFNLKKAKKYIVESVKLLNNTENNNTYRVLEIITIANLGYGDILLIEKNYKKAENKYLIALKYAEQLHKINSVRFNNCLNSVYNNLSVYYFQMNNLELSKKYNEKSIELLENSNLKNISNNIDFATTLMFKCDCLDNNSFKKSQTAKKIISLLEKIENNLKVIRLREGAKKYIIENLN